MLKITSFSLKSAQRWGLFPQVPYESDGWGLPPPPNPHVSPISLRNPHCAINYSRHFHVT